MIFNAHKYRLLAILCWLSLSINAQEPRLQFLSDSAGIAENIQVSLTFDHPANADAFFPKEPHYFASFSLINSTYFTTSTKDSISTDSVLYTLRSFEVEELKLLKLPVWIVENGDSTTYLSNTDSLFFKAIIPDSALAQAKLINGQPIQQKNGVNISLGLKAFFGILILLALASLVFLERIKQQVRLLKYQKRQRDFSENFKVIMLGEASPENLNQASTLWRNHMSWLEDVPFNTLSSVEIEKAAKSKKVGEAIREIESSVFGGVSSDRIPVALQILFSYSKERFKEKRMEYKKRLSKRN